ncbi:MAG: hypothetical protein BMS9Abin12_1921 [Acidimicrobiia bacterium]|nr:MAG: hypothetical protein BMS9Abin12_1921 [Acidimicrobiia bacterium]
MFDFTDSPVPVREDIKEAYRAIWMHFANPGPVFDAPQRSTVLAVARAARSDNTIETGLLPEFVETLATTLYSDPAAVDGPIVRAAADSAGDPAAVETIGLVAMLSAVDGTHRALGIELEPLPEPQPGEPTGRIASGLKRRRTHIPMPQGAIPVALDLLPEVGTAYRASFGPQYITGPEMAFPDFERSPGLNRAQIELVSSRTSLINECFY